MTDLTSFNIDDTTLAVVSGMTTDMCPDRRRSKADEQACPTDPAPTLNALMIGTERMRAVFADWHEALARRSFARRTWPRSS